MNATGAKEGNNASSDLAIASDSLFPQPGAEWKGVKRAGEVARWLRVLTAFSKFGCQHPNDSSQQPVAPVSGTLIPSSDLCLHLYMLVHTET